MARPPPPTWDAGTGRADWEAVLERARAARYRGKPEGRALPDHTTTDLEGYLRDAETRLTAVAADAIARIRGAALRGDSAVKPQLLPVGARSDGPRSAPELAVARHEQVPVTSQLDEAEPPDATRPTARIRQQAAALAAASSAARATDSGSARGDPDAVHGAAATSVAASSFPAPPLPAPRRREDAAAALDARIERLTAQLRGLREQYGEPPEKASQLPRRRDRLPQLRPAVARLALAASGTGGAAGAAPDEPLPAPRLPSRGAPPRSTRPRIAVGALERGTSSHPLAGGASSFGSGHDARLLAFPPALPPQPERGARRREWRRPASLTGAARKSPPPRESYVSLVVVGRALAVSPKR